MLWIRSGGGYVRMRELSEILLKKVEQKRREERQRFLKRRGKLGQGMDALKKGGSGTPLRNYDVYIYIVAGK